MINSIYNQKVSEILANINAPAIFKANLSFRPMTNYYIKKTENDIKTVYTNTVPSLEDIMSFDTVLSKVSNSVSSVDIDTRIKDAITSSANKYGIEENLIKAVIKQESSFNPNAVSSSGAMGLMQLMPKTAEGLGVRDAFNIEQNIDGGTKYLKEMLRQFDNNLELALAGYNAGPNAVKKYNGIPPYKETQNYVPKVLNYKTAYALEEYGNIEN